MTAADVVPTEEILKAVDAIFDEAVQFLRDIVAIDSTLEAGEGRVQSAIFDHLGRVLGNASDDASGDHAGVKRARCEAPFEVARLPVRLDEIRDRKGFSPVDWEYTDEQKFNVVARCRHPNCSDDEDAGSHRALLLQGHVDVVPANESDGWTSPPFSPVIKDGRVYGRGSGDMKAGVAAMIYALVALRRMGCLPAGDVTICTVVEEECTGNGALAAPLHTLLPPRTQDTKTAVIIPEPFPFLVTAQLGVMWFRATVTGKPCHVLQTSAGSNAIEGAYALYAALKGLEERYNEPKGNAHPAYRGHAHPVNFNLGKIEGGNWASSVPSKCTFEARVGFFPGVEIDDVKKDVESTLHDAAKSLGLELDISYRGFHAPGAVLLPEHAERNEKTGDVNAGESSTQTEFVETMQGCHQLAASSSNGDNDGKQAELPLQPITCTCDARFYSSLYEDPSRVAVTCYGPEARNIHGVDESVSLESLRHVTATMALFVRDWCGLVRM